MWLSVFASSPHSVRASPSPALSDTHLCSSLRSHRRRSSFFMSAILVCTLVYSSHLFLCFVFLAKPSRTQALPTKPQPVEVYPCPLPSSLFWSLPICLCCSLFLCLILTSLLLFCLSCQAIANRRATLVCKACPQRLNPSRFVTSHCPLPSSLFSGLLAALFSGLLAAFVSLLLAAHMLYPDMSSFLLSFLSWHLFICFVFLAQTSRTQELR